MKFGIIRARTRTVETADVAELRDAKVLAGLDADKVDHGSIFPGLGYVCGEYAMFEHPQVYFAVGRTLYPGNVVLYSYNTRGETVDFDLAPGRLPVLWLADESAVELAIKAGKIERPQAAIDGDVYWRWPEPKPDLDAVWRRMHSEMLKGRDVIVDGDTLITRLPDDKK